MKKTIKVYEDTEIPEGFYEGNNFHRVPWNKGETIDTDSRIKHFTRTDDVKDKIRQTHLSPDFKEKRYNLMKERGTLCPRVSKAEKEYLEYLYTLYDKNDVICQYFDKDRYPFKCDFYIKSLDLFIELNSTWTHGKHPFDCSNEEDIRVLNEWKEKSKESKYYENAIYTWTDLDVRKQETAKKNNLNYKTIY